jgi:hypothetical protein
MSNQHNNQNTIITDNNEPYISPSPPCASKKRPVHRRTMSMIDCCLNFEYCTDAQKYYESLENLHKKVKVNDSNLNEETVQSKSNILIQELPLARVVQETIQSKSNILIQELPLAGVVQETVQETVQEPPLARVVQEKDSK